MQGFLGLAHGSFRFPEWRLKSRRRYGAGRKGAARALLIHGSRSPAIYGGMEGLIHFIAPSSHID
ncbi:MAG: hypothetical protein WC836_14585 [Desulfobacula sp.]